MGTSTDLECLNWGSDSGGLREVMAEENDLTSDFVAGIGSERGSFLAMIASQNATNSSLGTSIKHDCELIRSNYLTKNHLYLS